MAAVVLQGAGVKVAQEELEQGMLRRDDYGAAGVRAEEDGGVQPGLDAEEAASDWNVTPLSRPEAWRL